MKNVFLAIVLSTVCSSAFAGSCGSCSSGPVTSVVSPVVRTSARVVRRVFTAPRMLFNGVRTRSACRRAARYERRCSVSCEPSACDCG